MIDYRIGDVRDRLAEIPDGSIDLIACSPPFLALRSYLPEGHEAKHAEIGSEANPAEFLSTLLGLAREWRRILTPHGSIAIELGDTFAGSGGAGGDYNADGLRAGQQAFKGSGAKDRPQDHDGGMKFKRIDSDGRPPIRNMNDKVQGGGKGWPLPKSLTGSPTLFAWSLAYGRNLLDPSDTLEPWRVRNVIVWARPNPAVGALGDKYRPATSYITVACPSDKRWFDLDAVRTEPSRPRSGTTTHKVRDDAPPLDHWTDDPTDPDDGDLTWKLSTEGSSLAHYAMWPSTLAARLIDSMCPREVCRDCGTPRRRIVDKEHHGSRIHAVADSDRTDRQDWNRERPTSTTTTTLGWSDCGHGNYRPGLTLDCFGGTGTTLAVADFLGRDAIGIDLDPRNADLYPLRRAEVERKLNPTAVRQLPGQADLFGDVA